MATKNITIENVGWNDVETLANITFVEEDTYILTIKGNYGGEVCIASSTPENNFFGHPLTANENFTYTHVAGDKLFIKATQIGTPIEAVLIIT